MFALRVGPKNYPYTHVGKDQEKAQSEKDSRPKNYPYTHVHVGKDQEKAQSEKDSHSKNRDGKTKKLTICVSLLNV